MFQLYKKHLNRYIFLSIILGAVAGLILPETSINLALPGALFLRALTMMIIPIITVSIIAGILNINGPAGLGRLGGKTFLYYFVTTGIAVVTGLILVNLINPGKGSENHALKAEIQSIEQAETPSPLESISVVIKRIIPDNIVSAATEGNVLGLIFFSIFLGAALLFADKSDLLQVQQLVNTSFKALIWMIDKIMLLAPVGIFFLVAKLTADFYLGQELERLGSSILWYTVTVALGLLIHGTFSLPLILYIFGVNPFRFLRHMFPAISTAFSTASSSATLPLTLECLEKRARIPNRIASFVAPLGSTVNMDGTAMYEAVAAVFIANMYGIELSFMQQCVVFLTATFSAVGAAGIPSAGLVMMTIVLSSVGLPVEGIQLIVVVDRILDMIRTGVNVWGDSIGAAVIAETETE